MDILTIVKSFSPNSDKIDLPTTIIWYLKSPPQAGLLEQFLIDILPSIDPKENQNVKLQHYGPSATGHALGSLPYSKLDSNEVSKLWTLLRKWIEKDFIIVTPSQWHSCSENCDTDCQHQSDAVAILSIVGALAIEKEDDELIAQVARMAILYQYLPFIKTCASLTFNFSFEVSKILFFSCKACLRIFVYDHSHSDFKKELRDTLSDLNATITIKKDRIVTSSEVHSFVAEALSIGDLSAFIRVRAELNITTLSLIDFIAACSENNYQLVFHMLNSSFPRFIKKRCHLTEILYAMKTCDFSPEWSRVLDHVLKVSDPEKTKLHSEDAIILMTMPFFSHRKSKIASHTNWDRPPRFTYGCPLLTDFDLLKGLEKNGKLQLWANGAKRIKIVMHPEIKANRKCIFILMKYNML